MYITDLKNNKYKRVPKSAPMLTIVLTHKNALHKPNREYHFRRVY